jgi:transposase
LVDPLGCLLAVLVLAADIADRDGAELLLDLYDPLYPWLAYIWADGSYAGALVTDLLTEDGIRLEIVSQLPAQHGFAGLPRRWVVERPLAWLTQGRRLVRDYARDPAYSEAWDWLSASHRTVKYLAPDLSAPAPVQRRTAA